MRFLHTADWHLGRLLHARSLIEDQAHILDQFVGCVRDSRPDAVLIAGDIYDRAVPPPEAVALLDDVLARIVLGLETPVVLIAGNHDSGERLGFGARLLASRGLHLAGRTRPDAAVLRLRDRHGDLDVFALPYAEPAAVRDAHRFEGSLSHESAMQLQCEAIRDRADRAARSVLVGHAFVIGGEASESERPLSVGGSGAVTSSVFDGFDYVALGHLHRPQTLGAGRIRYAGSLMKYSRSEAAHEKSVSLVELGAPGSLHIEEIALTPLRDLRILEGPLAELLQAGAADTRKGDYICARLTDTGALLDPLARLREVYPNALSTERAVLEQSGSASAAARHLRQLDTGDLFASFLRDVAGEEMDPPRRAAFATVLDALERSEREAE